MLSRQGILFCVIGATASGKSALSKVLLQAFPESLRPSISATTRAPREDEIDGVDYCFISRNEFEQRAAAGEFFEFEEVHGNFYGTPQRNLEESISNGQDLLLRIDIQGALNFKRGFPRNAVVVFVVPPSTKILKQRLLARGVISEAELSRRLATAAVEYRAVLDLAEVPGMIDFILVNDCFDDAAAGLREILAAERRRLSRIGRADLKLLCKV